MSSIFTPQNGSGLHFRPRRQDIGRHDALRQKGRGQNQAGNSLQEGRSSRFRARSTACTRPSDPHTERKRRGFPPRKAQIDAGRVPGNCSKTLRIRSCLQKYNYLYYKRIVGY